MGSPKTRIGTTISQAKGELPYPHKILEPHMQQHPPAGPKPPKLKYDRKEAHEYLKHTWEETKEFKK